jgi:CRISPR-associated endonuclease Csy4
MNCYQEITLIPNPEIGRYFLWSKTFQQIHLGLVEIQDDQNQVPIGISFPEYKVGDKCSALGGRLRLFAADEASLARLDVSKWLSRLNDYVHHTGIRPVPNKLIGHATYRRLQPKTGKERLARRYAKRHNLDLETALNSPVEMTVMSEEEGGYGKALLCYAELPNKPITTPFIRIKSLSNEQTFCLWIDKTVVDQPVAGHFSSYGLSSSTTVPEF